MNYIRTSSLTALFSTKHYYNESNGDRVLGPKSKVLPDYLKKKERKRRHHERLHWQYIFLIDEVSKTKVDRSQRWKYTLVAAVQLYLTAYGLFIRAI